MTQRPDISTFQKAQVKFRSKLRAVLHLKGDLLKNSVNEKKFLSCASSILCGVFMLTKCNTQSPLNKTTPTHERNHSHEHKHKQKSVTLT
jgi:hypothetical protein